VRLMWLASFLLMFGFSAWLYASGLYFLRTYGWGSLETGFLSMGACVAGVLRGPGRPDLWGWGLGRGLFTPA